MAARDPAVPPRGRRAWRLPLLLGDGVEATISSNVIVAASPSAPALPSAAACRAAASLRLRCSRSLSMLLRGRVSKEHPSTTKSAGVHSVSQ